MTNQIILTKIMNNLNAVIDYGSKNLRLGIFNETFKSIYFSKN